MKKLLLNLGVASLVGLPIVIVSSCSSGIEETILNVKLFSEITTISQQTIDTFLVEYDKAELLPELTEIEIQAKNNKKISLLSNIFVGVNIDNLADFVVSETVDGANKTITLTGTEGNVFIIPDTPDTPDKSSSILIAKASPTPTNKLDITLKPNLTTIEINQTILDFEKSENEEEMATALSVIFLGITADNLKPFEKVNPVKVQIIEITDVADKNKITKTIILIASPSYYFTNVADTILEPKVSTIK